MTILSRVPSCFSLLVAIAVFGGLSTGNCRDAGSESDTHAAGPVSVVVKADSVRFTVRIRSEQEVPDYQFYELGEARRLLLEAARRNGKLTPSVNTPEPNFDQSSRYNISSGPVYPQLTVDLFYPLKEGFDFIACAREINALVTGIAVPAKARFKYHIDAMVLWIAAPEEHRPQLLKLFAENVQAMARALGGKVKFDITNLATPVRQRPLDDTQVELSLEPSVTLEVFSSPPP